MNSGRVAIRYAKGLLKFSNERGVSLNLYKDAFSLIQILKESKSLNDLMENPSIENSEKLKILEKSLSDKIHPYFIEFLRMVIIRGRFEHTLNALYLFRDLYRKQNDILEVQVESVERLSDTELMEIESFVQKKFNKKTEMSTIIKPQLIAGYIVIVEGKIMDFSVSGQLSRFKKTLGLSVAN